MLCAQKGKGNVELNLWWLDTLRAGDGVGAPVVLRQVRGFSLSRAALDKSTGINARGRKVNDNEDKNGYGDGNKNQKKVKGDENGNGYGEVEVEVQRNATQ